LGKPAGEATRSVCILGKGRNGGCQGIDVDVDVLGEQCEGGLEADAFGGVVDGHVGEGFAQLGGEPGFAFVVAPAVVADFVDVGELVGPATIGEVEGGGEDDADEGAASAVAPRTGEIVDVAHGFDFGYGFDDACDILIQVSGFGWCVVGFDLDGDDFAKTDGNTRMGRSAGRMKRRISTLSVLTEYQRR